MTNKSLTSIQIQVLVLAMLGVEPYIPDVKPFAYDALIKQVNVEAGKIGSMIGLEINLSLSWFGEFAHHPIEEEYQLFIAYQESIHQLNPSFIKLIRTVGEEPGVVSLGNLTFITDKLREFNIW